MLKSMLLGVTALPALADPAAAEVVERSADHFVLRYEVGLETRPEDIYAAIGEVGQRRDGVDTVMHGQYLRLMHFVEYGEAPAAWPSNPTGGARARPRAGSESSTGRRWPDRRRQNPIRSSSKAGS